MQILLHSSKTMASKTGGYSPLDAPLFEVEAVKLAKLLQRTPESKLTSLMHISESKAAEVKELYNAWANEPSLQTPAIDAFKGDIYSGLQVATWSESDRIYAHEHLVILSGLYGALRACDGIMPYRLEMGYKLPNGTSMYAFWGDKLAAAIQPETDFIINLSAVEYTKAIIPFLGAPVITPKFMTLNLKTGEPEFVVVHAKIARGAFARWMIQKRINAVEDLKQFDDLGYDYSPELSTPEQLVFVCQKFQGIGLSVRLQ